MKRCPQYSTLDPQYLDSFGYDGPPSCCGEVVGGSGGHRRHIPCTSLATWWHPEDCFAYCDAHVLPHDVSSYLSLWSKS